MITSGSSVCIAGAGPTGALLALLLERRGCRVTLYETRRDPRLERFESSRSINLALADRGIHALKLAGVFHEIERALVPMRGRMVHARDGSSSLQLYGRRPNEVIYSVSRHRLNQSLLTRAAGRPGVRVKFEHRFEDIDFASNRARVRELHTGAVLEVPMAPLIAADGAGSRIRHRMAASGLIETRELPLEHGYKELSIPPDAAGAPALEREALHIWPRGDYMLIALPNQDLSFTATLFLPQTGPLSFASLRTPADVEAFLSTNFADVRGLMPDCLAEFERNPTGSLGTVYARTWHAAGALLLVGDAAHAIVPFHGQGMNCCFEDCVELDACLERADSWESAFSAFYASRKPNTDAIADMALENHLEMRERVAEPKFQLQQVLALELERRFPERFIPRYSMVTFHHEVPYRVAQERGEVQARLLAELTAHAAALDDVDFDRAAREIEARLTPLASASISASRA